MFTEVTCNSVARVTLIRLKNAHKYLAKQHNLSNDDGDILRRWRRNRKVEKEEKEEFEEDFLEKYLKKKDQGKGEEKDRYPQKG